MLRYDVPTSSRFPLGVAEFGNDAPSGGNRRRGYENDRGRVRVYPPGARVHRVDCGQLLPFREPTVDPQTRCSATCCTVSTPSPSVPSHELWSDRRGSRRTRCISPNQGNRSISSPVERPALDREEFHSVPSATSVIAIGSDDWKLLHESRLIHIKQTG